MRQWSAQDRNHRCIAQLLRDYRQVLPLLAAELGPDAAYTFLRQHQRPHRLTAAVLNSNIENLQQLMAMSRPKAFEFITKAPCSVTSSLALVGRALENLKVGQALVLSLLNCLHS